MNLLTNRSARWAPGGGLVSTAHSCSAWILAVAWMALAPIRSANAQCEPSVELPGVDGPVYAMVNWDPDAAGPLPPVLVVGGRFTMAGNIEPNHIAAWDSATRQWSPLGSGMSGSAELTAVYALAVLPNGNLVAGGDFLTAGGVSASWIASWNGTAWSSVGSGLYEPVRALAVMSNGDLVAGGDFWYVASWNGAAWSAIDSATTDGEVFALAVMPSGDLVVGGRFLNIGLTAANKIARWDGTAWSAMGAGMSDYVSALTVLPGGDLMAGGNFTTADGQDAFFTAQWNGTAWSPLGGLAGNVYALAVLPGGHVVAGGNFVVAGSVSALRVARWDGANWSALGTGVNSTVYSLAVLPGGDVVAGGLFDSAGGGNARAIASWNGTNWSAFIRSVIASDAAANDWFGDVAIDGDTVVVGARQDDNERGINAGAAYVYVKSGPPGNEVWTQQARLIGDAQFDLELNSQAGVSVDVSGNTALVGSWLWPNANATGLIYVFVRSGPPGVEVWNQQAALPCPQFGSFQYFGVSVSLEGDTAVVGTLAATGLNVGGQAFFYTRSGPPGGESWTAQQKFPSDGVPGDQFGISVAMSSSQDTAVVGASAEDNAGGIDAGSAYVFVKSGNSWVEQAKLTAADGAAGDEFGRQVAIVGDTIVVGSRWDDHAGGANAGSACVFTRSGAVWTQQAKLTASDAAAGDEFGLALTLAGDMLIVGAYSDDHAGEVDAGSAYVFTRSCSPVGDIWTERFKLTAADAAAGDAFGGSVALAGTTAVVSSLFDDHAGGIDAGSVHVFDLPCTGTLCPGDVNGDDSVDLSDLSVLLSHFGTPSCATLPEGDLENDGDVDLSDLALLLANFGATCP